MINTILSNLNIPRTSIDETANAVYPNDEKKRKIFSNMLHADKYGFKSIFNTSASTMYVVLENQTEPFDGSDVIIYAHLWKQPNELQEVVPVGEGDRPF